MDTELDDLFVSNDSAASTNDFGGDSDYEYTPATPEQRGDVFTDDGADDEQEENTDDGADTDGVDDEHDATDDELEQADESDSGDESETDAEEEDEPEEDEKPKKKTNGSVPRTRLNKEIQKRRDLEARIRELESGAPKAEPVKRELPPVASLKDKLSKDGFNKMQEAMIEGDTDSAFEMFAEMLTSVATEVRNDASELARQEAQDEFNANQTRSALSAVAAELAASYPELDHTGDDADETLIAEVVETRDIYINRGLSPVEALRKAVRMVAQDNELVDRKKGKAPVVTKNAAAVQKKVALAEKAKGRLGGSSTQVPVRENRVAHLSDSDFARTSEEARRRARGDYL